MTYKEIDELRIGDTIEIKIPEKKWSWLKFDYVPGEPKTKKVMISYISYDHGMFWYNDTDCLGRNDLMLNGKLVRKIIDTFDDDFFEKRIEEKKKFEEASKKINETLSKRSLSSIGTKYEYLVGRVIDSGEDHSDNAFTKQNYSLNSDTSNQRNVVIKPIEFVGKYQENIMNGLEEIKQNLNRNKKEDTSDIIIPIEFIA